jgi:hypothetical protein
MADPRKKILTKDTEKLIKTFSYQKGDMALGFDIRVDVKQRLKDFRDLLLEATKDVEKELSQRYGNGK